MKKKTTESQTHTRWQQRRWSTKQATESWSFRTDSKEFPTDSWKKSDRGDYEWSKVQFCP